MIIEVTLTPSGKPALKIRHMDKDESLPEVVLGQLLEAGKVYGLKVMGINGYLDTGPPARQSWENYYIVANDEIPKE